MKQNNLQIITPPACIGIMGGGQLARMFAIAAKQMGYKIAILDPDPSCPAHYFADYHVIHNYDNEIALSELAQKCQVITTEFENVPATSMGYLSSHTTVYPNVKSLQICQNRLKEKDFFNKLGIHTTKYAAIRNYHDIDNIDIQIFPAILKTNTFGYDGKGQIHVTNKQELITAFDQLNNVECILEKKLEIKKEISAIIARNSNCQNMIYPIVENIHKNGILDYSIAPAQIDDTFITAANLYATKIVDALDYIGILAIELFITHNNEIIANEMAPRPHNSGHHTIDIYNSSQFEQHVRACCNLALLPITSQNSIENAVMLNLLGDLWLDLNMLDKFTQILTLPNTKLHLYEKNEPKRGRKMGHITIIGSEAANTLTTIKQILQ